MEYDSVEAFVEWAMDEDLEEYTHLDLRELHYHTQRRVDDLRKELEGYGLRLARREPERRVRGFQTSSNDRWYGPGADKTHGGSGWEQINGFAGDEG